MPVGAPRPGDAPPRLLPAPAPQHPTPHQPVVTRVQRGSPLPLAPATQCKEAPRTSSQLCAHNAASPLRAPTFAQEDLTDELAGMAAQLKSSTLAIEGRLRERGQLLDSTEAALDGSLRVRPLPARWPRNPWIRSRPHCRCPHRCWPPTTFKRRLPRPAPGGGARCRGAS